jgi:CubicO group peptidase (beta-lactamase class C family)
VNRSVDNQFSESVTEALREVMGDRVHPPQVAVAVVYGGEIVKFHGIDATPDTRFRIASMTKSFTAAAVLRLRDHGVWRLDDPLSRWVPETIALKGPTSDSPPITLRHLLTMAAGMATDDPWGDRQLDLDAASFRSLMTSAATFAAVPGTAMQYSNYGYALLGEAIARATKLSPQRYITKEILEPLEMSSTTWDVPAGSDFADPQHFFADLTEQPPLGDGAFAPMGGLWSTIKDLAKWVAFLSDGFPPRDGLDSSVLSRASRREMQQSHTSWPPRILDTSQGSRMSEIGYGMGLMISAHPKLGKVVNHSGGLPGYGSNMRWVTDSGIGIVALANRTYAPMRSLTNELVEMFADDPLVSNHDRRWAVEAPLLEFASKPLLAALWADDGVADHADESLWVVVPFAENVFLDLPLDRRMANAREHRARVGTLGEWALTTTSATMGTFSAQSASHTVTVMVMLTPQRDPLIQMYEVTVSKRP